MYDVRRPPQFTDCFKHAASKEDRTLVIILELVAIGVSGNTLANK